MGKFENAIHEMCAIENQAGEDNFLNNIHALAKLFVTVLYVCMVTSFPKYNLTGLVGMIIYPLIIFNLGDIKFGKCIKRIRLILPLICIIGIFNPFFDRNVLLTMGGVKITGGEISMVTLMIKGILTVIAIYILIITTTIDRVCMALKKIHIPEIIVMIIQLIYRYINVLLKETKRIVEAYSLRAPGQKGINFKAWGSLPGQLLLRSIDRATDVHNSMSLRGYNFNNVRIRNYKLSSRDYVWMILWTLVIIAFRVYPVFEIVGGLFT